MGEFRMPSLGADMDEGILREWLIAPGDTVHRGQIVAVVETAKSAVEVECFEDGVIDELIGVPGQTYPVGAVLARLTPAAGPPAIPPAIPPELPAKIPSETPTELPSAVAASHHRIPPLLRRMAAELGLDAEAVVGTGFHGALTREDIERAAPPAHPSLPSLPAPSSPPSKAPPVASSRPRVTPYARRLAAQGGLDLATLAGLHGSGAGGAVRADDVRRALAARQPVAPVAPPQPEPPSRAFDMRGSIAALMTISNRDIPHYYLSTTIDLHAALAWMTARNRELPVEDRLVPSALLLKAVALATRAVPELNGHWVDDEFRPATDVDLGVIVSLRTGGLLVPILPRADTLSVPEIMTGLRDLTQRARRGRLRGSDLAMPSITVSNLGDQGVESVLGVIYPPQVALVGLGTVSDRPWAVDGLLGIRPLLTATLAGDHRASDGAVGARLLKRLDQLLQKPEEL